MKYFSLILLPWLAAWSLSAEDGETRAALLAVLDDEYHALAFYDAVLREHGPIQPFANLRDAERRHADALIGQLRRFGGAIPANTWEGRIILPPTVEEITAEAIADEVENADLFAKLRPMVTDDETLAVMDRLAAATKDRHLPALKGERKPGMHGQGAGHGHHPGQGHRKGHGQAGCGGKQGGCGMKRGVGHGQGRALGQAKGGACGGSCGAAVSLPKPNAELLDEAAGDAFESKEDQAARARAVACGCGMEKCTCGGAKMQPKPTEDAESKEDQAARARAAACGCGMEKCTCGGAMMEPAKPAELDPVPEPQE